MLTMLAWGLGSGTSDAPSQAEFYEAFWDETVVRAELVELLEVYSMSARRRDPGRLCSRRTCH